MNQRDLVTSLAVIPGMGCLFTRTAEGRTTVSRLETFVVKVNRRGNWVLVRLTADDGLTGIGEASHGGSDERVIQFIKVFFESIRTRKVHEIERFRETARPIIAREGRDAAVAFSALEQCLWDICGKAAGMPVRDLIGGGLRGRIRNYANINRSTEDRSPRGFARMADRAVESGFDAVKLAPFDGPPATGKAEMDAVTDLGVECIAEVRRVIGPQRDLLVDAHDRFDLERGLDLLKRLESYNLFWLEEVTPPGSDLADLAAINRVAKMPTAGGESIFGIKGFHEYVSAKAVDILMPDVKYCGGVFELKKIAALAEAAGVPVAPHGPASPLGNAVAAQVASTLPNFKILEYSFGEVAWRADLIEPPEEIDRGYLTLSDKPGYGITLNLRTVKEHLA
jgi:galactonate dehydratase